MLVHLVVLWQPAVLFLSAGTLPWGNTPFRQLHDWRLVSLTRYLLLLCSLESLVDVGTIFFEGLHVAMLKFSQKYGPVCRWEPEPNVKIINENTRSNVHSRSVCGGHPTHTNAHHSVR